MKRLTEDKRRLEIEVRASHSVLVVLPNSYYPPPPLLQETVIQLWGNLMQFSSCSVVSIDRYDNSCNPVLCGCIISRYVVAY